MASAPFPLSTPNLYTLIENPATATDLVNAVIAAMESVGWTEVGPITGGVQLLGASPQGYTVFCNVTLFTSGGSDWLSIQLVSAVSAATGAQYLIAWSPTVTYQVIVHPCGGAISQLNEDSNPVGSNCIFGIPAVATNCGISTALGTITEVWFSFGDWSGSGSVAEQPRVNIDVNDFDGTGRIVNQTGCINGVVATLNTLARWDTPEIIRFSSLAEDDGASSSHPLFYGEKPMTYPAFVGWVNTSEGPILERGQMYNAVVVGINTVMNAIATIDGYSFINYTNDYFWGGIWLMQGAAAALGNYAY